MANIFSKMIEEEVQKQISNAVSDALKEALKDVMMLGAGNAPDVDESGNSITKQEEMQKNDAPNRQENGAPLEVESVVDITQTIRDEIKKQMASAANSKPAQEVRSLEESYAKVFGYSEEMEG